MAYDHEEQEQLATIKDLWKQYGNLATWVLIAALGSYAAWTGWNTYQGNRIAQAAQLYEEFQGKLAAKDGAAVQRMAADLESRFGSSIYAQMSALAAARFAFDANDVATAKTRLQWLAEKGADPEFQAIARVRLAGILLDEKAYEEGLKVLSGEFPASFAGVVADRKGDLLAAQGKKDEARAAYQAALAKLDAQDPGRQMIQFKLEAIGGAPAKAA